MAGAFDPRGSRDVLTSLLNGVGPYKEVERDEEARLKRKQEKKDQKREERKRIKAAAKARHKELIGDAGRHATTEGNFASTSSLQQIPTPASSSVTPFWRARPTIHIPAMQRSVSVTPSPTLSTHRHASTPGSTPGPSISSSTSQTSSKRPRTPDDDEGLETESASAPQPRKKRAAAKKGWKGWVEGSPPPSDKLINLDAVPLLQERRTRSGKNFDAISIGKDGWV